MPTRGTRRASPLRQQLWASAVEIADGTGGVVDGTCIIARGIGEPQGVEPFEWRLLTNRTISGADQVIELIEWYRARWEIEIYIQFLMYGCEVETLQLGAVDRIERALALFMVVGWRVTNLMRLGSIALILMPSSSSPPTNSRHLFAHEAAKTNAPSTPERSHTIGRTAGRFLGRKGDGEPGVKTICADSIRS